MNKSPNIENNQNDSFSLGSIPKKELFNHPDGYFDTLPAKVLEKINAGKTLYSLEKPSDANVPVQYFDTLTQQVLQKTTQQNKVVSMRPKIVRWLAVAASITLISTIGARLFFGNAHKTSEQTAQTPDLNTQYTNYLLEEMPVEDLQLYFAEQSMHPTDTADAVVDYLLDETDGLELENL